MSMSSSSSSFLLFTSCIHQLPRKPSHCPRSHPCALFPIRKNPCHFGRHTRVMRYLSAPCQMEPSLYNLCNNSKCYMTESWRKYYEILIPKTIHEDKPWIERQQAQKAMLLMALSALVLSPIIFPIDVIYFVFVVLVVQMSPKVLYPATTWPRLRPPALRSPCQCHGDLVVRRE